MSDVQLQQRSHQQIEKKLDRLSLPSGDNWTVLDASESEKTFLLVVLEHDYLYLVKMTCGVVVMALS